jgi:hypothetical protein
MTKKKKLTMWDVRREAKRFAGEVSQRRVEFGDVEYQVYAPYGFRWADGPTSFRLYWKSGDARDQQDAMKDVIKRMSHGIESDGGIYS